MPDWNWGESQSESGVVHQSTANTDHNDAATLKQGYDYATFSEITPDPIACWPLHEDSGTTAYDVAGTNDGTFNGATLGQTGILGTTVPSFDGVDDGIDISPFSTFSSYTISFWSKCSSVSDGDSDQQITFNNNNAVEMRNNGAGTQYLWQNDGSTWHSVTASTTSGVWEFWTGVWDGSATELFKNGTSQATTSVSSMRSLGYPSGIAYYPNGPSIHFEGNIADVRVYNTALSTSQIQTLYDVVNTAGTWTGTAKPL